MPITEYFQRHNIQPDAAQQQVCNSLTALMSRAVNTRTKGRSGGLSGLLGKSPKSAYVWGRPGRGKTMLMDALVGCAELKARRVHYHNFLRDLHEGMNANIGTVDYLAVMANQLADECEVFCLDEFHLHDVADVILFERFLKVLLERKVFVVLTSNYEPQNLLPDPDVHHRALNCIAMIEKHFEVLTLNGDKDYRYRNIAAENNELPDFYYSPADSAAEQQIAEQVGVDTNALDTGYLLKIRNRTMPARLLIERPADDQELAGHDGLVWLDFKETCDAPRSHLDYLEVAECYGTLVLSGITDRLLQNPNTLRRFIWLIDVLYEYRRQLFATSDKPLLDMLREGDFEEDTSRLLSRLVEMKTCL